mmetsp:Transcript_54254/g.129323  ORF Transcript_54254/g.129323 Transcript_54254/m.129323 type:complete len:423 (+) Transcript_54254:94-1362(+)
MAETRALASDAENECLKGMKMALGEELKKLEAEGRNFPHTTGDIFLLRVLRGNDGDVAKATAWYRKCLQVRAENGLDEIYNEIKDLPFSIAALPGSAEIGKHFQQLADEKTLITPSGDLIQVDLMGGIRWKKFVDEVTASQYTKWQLTLQESKLLALDRLSRAQGRLVKCVTFVDLRNSRLPPRQFLKTEKELKTNLCETTATEVVHRIFFVGAPRFFYSLWKLAQPLLPQRTLANIFLLGADFAQDADVLAEAGSGLLAKLIASSSSGAGGGGAEEDLSGEAQMILAGDVFELAVHVAAQQRVSWKFRIGGAADIEEAGARGRLGGLVDRFKEATDLRFEVSAVWDADESDVPQSGDAKLELKMVPLAVARSVAHKDGEICGSTDAATRSGIVLVRWTNVHSLVRAKVLAQYSVAVESGNS